MAQDGVDGASPAAHGLTGAQRVAAILLAMGNPPATRVLKHFDVEDLRAVTRAAAQLGAVPPSIVELLVGEFETDFAAGADLLGDVGQARALIRDAVSPDQAATIISEALNVEDVNVWERIAAAPEAELAATLKGEHPLTVTYLLSKLESGFAAKVVASLPRDLRNDVLVQMMSPMSISEAASEVVDRALREQFLGARQKASPNDQRARMAQIINGLEPSDADDVMKALEQEHPKDAGIVKSMLFSFNDLTRLSQRARALLFDKLATDLVVLALRGTDAAFRDVALSSMAARGRRLVESELKNASSVPASEIGKARRKIAETVLGMAQRGEIEIAATDEAEAA